MGNKVDSASLAIAAGSSATSAAALVFGTVEIAHGLATTPTFAYAAPLCADTLAAVGRKTALVGVGATYVTFITASANIGASAVQTGVTSAMSSSVIMTFVWVALG